MTTRGIRDRTRAVPGRAPGIRHDLRHVLSTVQALLTVADAPDALPEQLRRLVATARREAGLALELLESLPAVQDAGSPFPAVEAAPGSDAVCDLDGVLRAAAETAARTGRAVTVRSNAPLLVPVSRTAMTRIVRNLLGNALAASGPTGTVELCGVRGERTGRTGDGPPVVRLEVHDDGPGIPPRGAHRPGGGGLAVVRSLVLPAGGWLVLGRSDRGGACAAVALPEACREAPA